MKGQPTFADIEYAERKRKTKREEFLNTMEEIIPWDEWVAYIKPYYFTGKRGRPPVGIEKMLRMYLLQVWFHLADEVTEDAIYDRYEMRSFVKITFFEEQVPDAATLLKFRHILEKKKLQQTLFEAINRNLEKCGMMMRGGTIVDATIIEAPTSTKNTSKSRDPEMHATKKGNEWHFGMKCSIGVDPVSGCVHTLETTAANVHDIEVAYKLIRKDDAVVNGDAGYLGIEKRDEIANDEHLSKIDYRINKRPGKAHKQKKQLYKNCMNHLDYIAQPDWDAHIEYMKSKVRCKVEHPFRIVKGMFGYRKTVYRGLKKNACRLYLLFGFANLLKWVNAGCPQFALEMI
jgi:IS5 family transposase